MDLTSARKELGRALTGMRVGGFNFHSIPIIELERYDRNFPDDVCLELVGGWWIEENRAIEIVPGSPDSQLDPVRVGRLTQLIGADVTSVDLEEDGTLVLYTNSGLVVTAWRCDKADETSWHFHTPNWRDNTVPSWSIHCDEEGVLTTTGL